ncbi:hypothetical protein BDY19DRAFT_997794 [Irpex rosettiformis]|uniref:Uncharacterized protein n=1 Tax=Irpex rosettiformis TaxID=378272 RepID=A0ACB8TQK1_9APHY|nr:hypothetical protein BDY19DRAFT_997794 [Irpex rosettiformis]
MSSLGASIPPELFEDILFYVGDEGRLWCSVDPTARREEMKHLSACALTCVYWAQLTRERMFRRLVLRSAKDINDLRSLLRASSSDRLNPIGKILLELVIYYKLGDLLWFYNVPGLVASGADKLYGVFFHVLGPVPPAFMAGNTRRSVLHPLFFAVPRVMPMTSFHGFTVNVTVEDIHFTHPTMLYNLLQDCKLLHPRGIACTNLTWDHDPTATLSSFGWALAHRSPPEHTWLSQCTGNAFAAAMALSVPRHEFFRRPHLNTTDSSSLLDIIRASCGQDASPDLVFSVIPGFNNVQGCTAAKLTPGVYSAMSLTFLHRPLNTCVDCDLAFQWWHNDITFYCIASRRPGDDINIHYATHVIIEPMYGGIPGFMELIKTIDWVVFLRGVQAFPDLRGIIIQYRYWAGGGGWRKCLVELVPLLREAWAGVDSYLQLYNDTGDWMHPKWTQIPPSSVLEDIKRTRELEAAMNSLPIKPEPNVEAESPASDSHNDNNLASDS